MHVHCATSMIPCVLWSSLGQGPKFPRLFATIRFILTRVLASKCSKGSGHSYFSDIARNNQWNGGHHITSVYCYINSALIIFITCFARN